jgi:REP element-mobilizing transposase RayT
MANTLTSILIHVTFSTKNREPMITKEVRPALFQYVGGVCREMKCVLMHAGGVSDHVHLLISLDKTVCVSDLMMHVKRASSSWMKNNRAGQHLFAWQDGYFAFSVGHDDVERVRTYFDGQEEHHAKTDFKTEMEMFLKKYGVEFDAKYVWN